MIGLLYHICQAASDIAIPIFAFKVLVKKDPKLNKTGIAVLLVFLAILYQFYTLNYIYVTIPHLCLYDRQRENHD